MEGGLLHFIKIMQWERWISERVHVHERKSSANILLKLDGSSVLCYLVCPSGQAERQRRNFFFFFRKLFFCGCSWLVKEGHFSVTVLSDHAQSNEVTLMSQHWDSPIFLYCSPPPAWCGTHWQNHSPLWQVPLSAGSWGAREGADFCWHRLHRRYLKIHTLSRLPAVCSLTLWCHFGGKTNPILISSHYLQKPE